MVQSAFARRHPVCWTRRTIPSATRQGFYWWEVDITYYLLKVMSWMGIIWDLKPVPVSVRDHHPRRIDRL